MTNILYIYTVCPFIWWWTLRFFHVLPIVNSAAMNTGVCVFKLWFSVDMCPEIELQDYMLTLFLVFFFKPTRISRTDTQKRCLFHYRGLECKSRKSRNTWNYRPIWPWSTEWSRVKANRVLTREHTGHSKHRLPTQEKTLHMDITRWSTPNHIDYILCSQRWRSSIWSAKTRPGADFGTNHELLIAKFRVKLKKVEKTTQPFRYDLNQIP